MVRHKILSNLASLSSSSSDELEGVDTLDSALAALIKCTEHGDDAREKRANRMKELNERLAKNRSDERNDENSSDQMSKNSSQKSTQKKRHLHITFSEESDSDEPVKIVSHVPPKQTKKRVKTHSAVRKKATKHLSRKVPQVTKASCLSESSDDPFMEETVPNITIRGKIQRKRPRHHDKTVAKKLTKGSQDSLASIWNVNLKR